MEHIEGRFVYGDDVYIPDEYLDEVWEYIPGIDYYMVSNYGRVWSEKSQMFLKPKPMDSHGHLGFCLSQNGVQRYVYQHRIMAQAFIPNPDGYPIVRHLNDIADDNDLCNLAWGTQRDNQRDSVENGTAHVVTPEEREIGLRKTRVPVIAINLETGEKIRFISKNEAGRVLRVEPANIYKVLIGERKQTGGWTFEYDERR